MEWYELGEKDKKLADAIKRQGSVVAPRERNVENRLTTQVEDAGGMALKWTSPRRPGVPDRIVVFRTGVYLVETKAIGGRLTNSQKAMFPMFYRMGVPVFILNTRETVDDWIDDLVLDRIPRTVKTIPWNFRHTVFRPGA